MTECSRKISVDELLHLQKYNFGVLGDPFGIAWSPILAESYSRFPMRYIGGGLSGLLTLTSKELELLSFNISNLELPYLFTHAVWEKSDKFFCKNGSLVMLKPVVKFVPYQLKRAKFQITKELKRLGIYSKN